MAKKKPKTAAKLVNEAAELLQKLVRMKAADDDGLCACVTCGKSEHWKDMQGGHFIERGKSYSKLLEENIHPQCPYCNQFGMMKTSVMLTYRAYMVDMYGEEFVQHLKFKADENAPVKRYKADMLDMVDDLNAQIKEQYERLGR
jgi:hypothetical protein